MCLSLNDVTVDYDDDLSVLHHVNGELVEANHSMCLELQSTVEGVSAVESERRCNIEKGTAGGAIITRAERWGLQGSNA